MTKQSFTLKVKWCNDKRNPHHVSAVYDSLNRKRKVVKDGELEEAVEWCRLNNCRGWKAKKSGLFPSIKDPRTINARLDGKVKNKNERSYCKILTEQEEESLVRFIKNRNRCLQSLSEKEVEKYALAILKVRILQNKKGGKKGTKRKLLFDSDSDSDFSDSSLDSSDDEISDDELYFQQILLND